MYEIIIAGGWLMLPILLCSIAVITIAIERWLALRPRRVAPPHLLRQIAQWLRNRQLNRETLAELRGSSPLGQILAAGLANAHLGREAMKECIEETANQVIHHLERYVSALGTIAAVAPLLGLLGTVFGMIKVFNAILLQGAGNPSILAGGISEALITTATGLAVAIPALVLHRYFERRIDTLVVTMENHALKLVDALHGERAASGTGESSLP